LHHTGDYIEEKNYGEQTAQLIDTEVKILVEDSHDRTRSILQKLRPALDAVALLLQEKEVMSGEEILAVLHQNTDGNKTVG
jgi:cell division protease FtsH